VRPKAGANKGWRLILSRGLDTPSKKYLEDGPIVKVRPIRLGPRVTNTIFDGTKETKMKTTLFAVVLYLLAASLVNAQTASPSSQSDQPLDPKLGISTLQLWPSGAPEVQGTPGADLPTLTVFRPQEGTGSAVIVAPGGAYMNLSSNLEGRQVADWFTTQGVTAFVLKYRMGAKYLYPIPLEDAQRAVRLVRSLAATYGFLPDRIGFVGFSAGGHLAAATGTLFDAGKPDSGDPLERLSSRPDFLVLGYPWLNAMQPSGHYITYCSVIETIPPATCKVDEQKIHAEPARDVPDAHHVHLQHLGRSYGANQRQCGVL
jgi:acetyl esterase/lipase